MEDSLVYLYDLHEPQEQGPLKLQLNLRKTWRSGKQIWVWLNQQDVPKGGKIQVEMLR